MSPHVFLNSCVGTLCPCNFSLFKGKSVFLHNWDLRLMWFIKISSRQLSCLIKHFTNLFKSLETVHLKQITWSWSICCCWCRQSALAIRLFRSDKFILFSANIKFFHMSSKGKHKHLLNNNQKLFSFTYFVGLCVIHTTHQYLIFFVLFPFHSIHHNAKLSVMFSALSSISILVY